MQELHDGVQLSDSWSGSTSPAFNDNEDDVSYSANHGERIADMLQ